MKQMLYPIVMIPKGVNPLHDLSLLFNSDEVRSE